MKMTWLHKFFGLFFIPADGRAKSADFDGAAIPPPIFSMNCSIQILVRKYAHILLFSPLRSVVEHARIVFCKNQCQHSKCTSYINNGHSIPG